MDPSGIPLWRRVAAAAINIAVFVTVLLGTPRIVRDISGGDAPWWIYVAIFLVPIVAIDVLLYATLLRPVRSGDADPATTIDRQPE